MCSYDLRGNIIEINEALERAIGYTRQEVRGMNVSDILDAASLESARLDILKHVGGAGPAPQQVIARAKDGRCVTLELTTRLVFEKGTPVAVQGFGRDVTRHDVTGRKLDALREAEARLSTKTNQLAQFTEDLKQLHRLSTTNYESLDQVFADYLKTGCEVFRLQTGMVLQVDEGAAVIRAAHGGLNALRADARLPLKETHWASIGERLRTQSYSGSGEQSGVHPELRICLATPILVDAELYGTLSFSASFGGRTRAFSSQEQEIIELMALGIGRSILEDRIRSERLAGENLERDRNRVLEMVAENRPLASTLAQVAAMLEGQCSGVFCSVLLLRDGSLCCEAAPRLPESYLKAVDELRIPAPGVAEQNHRVAEALDGAHFPLSTRLGLDRCEASSILSGAGQLLGAIVLHFRSDGPSVPDPEILRMASRLAGIAIDQRQLTDRLEFQAQHDSLTGLPNRFHLLELLKKRLAAAESRDGSIAVLFIDLDRFKQINDTLGHLVGDRILIQVAERLKRGLLHEDDVAGRMGGDEFTVILSHVPDHEFAFRGARQFLQSLRAPYIVDGHELFVTASIGMSSYPKNGADAATLLQNSDLAMYRAKNAGKNDLELVVQESRSGAIKRLEMENALRRALEKSELELYFQPIVSIDGELDGLEVLLAWHHPRFGRISPKQFIPMAEETGLIVSIGSWVMHQACWQGARWMSAGFKPARIAVNVSAIQFARHDFVDTVAAALASTGFPAKWLELELTESFVIRDIEESARRLSRLRELGVRISIDDFGTGYSSLSYLRQLPVDTLKIDQSFLRDLQIPSGSLPVVRTIVSLAHNMNLSVVAEGVETIEDLELLRVAGCDKVQGHLYGESLRVTEAEQLLANKDRIVPALTR
jgi:diguanylate cyclase (GGDEF)-like protein/PAS domain S-box-containing protein